MTFRDLINETKAKNVLSVIFKEIGYSIKAVDDAYENDYGVQLTSPKYNESILNTLSKKIGRPNDTKNSDGTLVYTWNNVDVLGVVANVTLSLFDGGDGGYKNAKSTITLKTDNVKTLISNASATAKPSKGQIKPKLPKDKNINSSLESLSVIAGAYAKLKLNKPLNNRENRYFGKWDGDTWESEILNRFLYIANYTFKTSGLTLDKNLAENEAKMFWKDFSSTPASFIKLQYIKKRIKESLEKLG